MHASMQICYGLVAPLPRPRGFAATVQSRRGSVPVGFEDASSQSVQGFDAGQLERRPFIRGDCLPAGGSRR